MDRLSREALEATLPTMPAQGPAERADAGDDAGATLEERIRRAMPIGVGTNVAYYRTGTPTTREAERTKQSLSQSLRSVGPGPTAPHSVVEAAVTAVRHLLKELCLILRAPLESSRFWALLYTHKAKAVWKNHTGCTRRFPENL